MTNRLIFANWMFVPLFSLFYKHMINVPTFCNSEEFMFQVFND
jgi:hypothetical protein